jgi:bifunctional DNA-binding transcriptional regulator/antitoxin component of YhaV-PrlF toxin-antitoxin module
VAVKAKVRKVGTSLGVIIPKEHLKELGVKEGDTIILRRIERPAPEIRGILRGTGFAFTRESQDRGESTHGMGRPARHAR